MSKYPYIADKRMTLEQAIGMTAKEFLRGIQGHERRIKALMERRQHYYDMAMQGTGTREARRIGGTTQASRVEMGETILIRWMLGGGQKYAEAVERYHPFDRLVDEDPATRAQIVELIRRHPGHQIYVIVNNKAEGCAPLSLVKLAEALRGSI